MCSLETRTQQEEENGNTTEELVSPTEEHKFQEKIVWKKALDSIMENTEGSNNVYIIFYRLLEVLEDFSCVKNMHFFNIHRQCWKYIDSEEYFFSKRC